MGEHYVADQAHAMQGAPDPAFQVFVLENVGFQLEHEQQNEPGGLINTRCELTGPVEKRRFRVQGMDGPAPVFKDVEHEVDYQQRIDRPLDGLLNLVQRRFVYF